MLRSLINLQWKAINVCIYLNTLHNLNLKTVKEKKHIRLCRKTVFIYILNPWVKNPEPIRVQSKRRAEVLTSSQTGLQPKFFLQYKKKEEKQN